MCCGACYCRLFGQSLYWRTNAEVTYVTKRLVEIFLKNSHEDKVRTILLAVLGSSTKVDFDLNAEYLHTFLMKKTAVVARLLFKLFSLRKF